MNRPRVDGQYLLLLGLFIGPGLLGLCFHALGAMVTVVDVGVVRYALIAYAILFYGIFAVALRAGLNRKNNFSIFRRPVYYSHRSVTRLVASMSIWAIIDFSIKMYYLYRAGGISVYAQGPVLDEVRQTILSEVIVLAPGLSHISTVLSGILFCLPVAIMFFWSQLSARMRFASVAASLLWPLAGLATLGRLNLFLVIYIYVIGILLRLYRRPGFWLAARRVLLVAGVLAVGAFSLGAVRQYSGEGERADRSVLAERDVEEFADWAQAGFGVVQSLSRQDWLTRATIQFVGYETHPWRYAEMMLAGGHLNAQPFTFNFYFLGWPLSALRIQEPLAERQYKFRDAKLASGVPAAYWVTALISLAADFGLLIGALMGLAAAWLAGRSVGGASISIEGATVMMALLLFVLMFHGFSAFSVYPIEFAIYYSVGVVIIKKLNGSFYGRA